MIFFVFLFKGLSRSYDLTYGFGGLTWMVRAFFFFPFNNFFFSFRSFCGINFCKIHLSIFNLLRIGLCDLSVFDASDQMA
jgi:hypothetical protein